MAPKTRATSADASASASVFHEARKRYSTEQTKVMVPARSIICTIGTCAYMMRCTSPISRSGGACTRPTHAA